MIDHTTTSNPKVDLSDEASLDEDLFSTYIPKDTNSDCQEQKHSQDGSIGYNTRMIAHSNLFPISSFHNKGCVPKTTSSTSQALQSYFSSLTNEYEVECDNLTVVVDNAHIPLIEKVFCTAEGSYEEFSQSLSAIGMVRFPPPFLYNKEDLRWNSKCPSSVGSQKHQGSSPQRKSDIGLRMPSRTRDDHEEGRQTLSNRKRPSNRDFRHIPTAVSQKIPTKGVASAPSPRKGNRTIYALGPKSSLDSTTRLLRKFPLDFSDHSASSVSSYSSQLRRIKNSHGMPQSMQHLTENTILAETIPPVFAGDEDYGKRQDKLPNLNENPNRHSKIDSPHPLAAWKKLLQGSNELLDTIVSLQDDDENARNERDREELDQDDNYRKVGSWEGFDSRECHDELSRSFWSITSKDAEPVPSVKHDASVQGWANLRFPEESSKEKIVPMEQLSIKMLLESKQLLGTSLTRLRNNGGESQPMMLPAGTSVFRNEEF